VGVEGGVNMCRERERGREKGEGEAVNVASAKCQTLLTPAVACSYLVLNTNNNN